MLAYLRHLAYKSVDSAVFPYFFAIICNMILDRTDQAILGILQHDGRISNVELARQVGLSESACLRRVRQLEQEGVIDGYVALVNQAQAGYPSNVLVQVTLHRQQQEDLKKFEAAVRGLPEVMECYLMAGEADYFLRVVVADAGDFERIHSEQLTRLPGVDRVQSSFALRAVVKTTELPLE